MLDPGARTVHRYRSPRRISTRRRPSGSNAAGLLDFFLTAIPGRRLPNTTMADPLSTNPAPVTSTMHDGLPMPRRRLATIAIMATLVLVVLDGAIANVALPTIALSLNASPASTIWVVGAYQ